MRKSMRRAEARLAEARKYVASYYSKSAAPKSALVVKPVNVVTNTKSMKGMKVESAEIKKLEKGRFFVVVTCNGKRHEVQKRFKSTTKAQEWISNHEYINLQ